MPLGEEFMNEARAKVKGASSSYSQRIKKKGFYKVRKELQHLPRTALTSVGSAVPVPVLGSIINKLVDKGIEKFDSAYKQKKREKAQAAATPLDLDSLRKVAKYDAKDLVTCATNIESNQVKLKQARAALQTALQAYVAAADKEQLTGELVSNVAVALCELDRYEEKILALLYTAGELLEVVKAYVWASSDETAKQEKEFIDDVNRFDDLPTQAETTFRTAS